MTEKEAQRGQSSKSVVGSSKKKGRGSKATENASKDVTSPTSTKTRVRISNLPVPCMDLPQRYEKSPIESRYLKWIKYIPDESIPADYPHSTYKRRGNQDEPLCDIPYYSLEGTCQPKRDWGNPGDIYYEFTQSDDLESTRVCTSIYFDGIDGWRRVRRRPSLTYPHPYLLNYTLEWPRWDRKGNHYPLTNRAKWTKAESNAAEEENEPEPTSHKRKRASDDQPDGKNKRKKAKRSDEKLSIGVARSSPVPVLADSSNGVIKTIRAESAAFSERANPNPADEMVGYDGDERLHKQIEQLCGNLNSVVREYARLNEDHGQTQANLANMAKEMQHLRDIDIRLREENGQLQEELRMMVGTISGLRKDNEEAKRTITSLSHDYNERSEVTLQRLRDERDLAIHSAHASNRELNDLRKHLAGLASLTSVKLES